MTFLCSTGAPLFLAENKTKAQKKNKLQCGAERSPCKENVWAGRKVKKKSFLVYTQNYPNVGYECVYNYNAIIIALHTHIYFLYHFFHRVDLKNYSEQIAVDN